MHSGHCLCGAVKYEVDGPIRDVIACHCEECQRVSSHFVAATAAHHSDVAITEDEGLAWYEGTSSIRRGFCKLCGSTLFFDHGPDLPMGIAAGSLDNSDDVKIAVHIWTEEAGPYYNPTDIADGTPKLTSSEWRARSGWDPLGWSDGGDHRSRSRQFNRT